MFLSFIATAQNKIVISYDKNGNRILRERICNGCRPAAPPADNDNSVKTQQASSNRNEPLQALSTSFQVYPNPTTEHVFVSLSNEALLQSCTIVLTDLLGKEHFYKKNATSQTLIPLQHLSAGVYFIGIYMGSKKSTVKVVKE